MTLMLSLFDKLYWFRGGPLTPQNASHHLFEVASLYFFNLSGFYFRGLKYLVPSHCSPARDEAVTGRRECRLEVCHQRCQVSSGTRWCHSISGFYLAYLWKRKIQKLTRLQASDAGILRGVFASMIENHIETRALTSP